MGFIFHTNYVQLIYCRLYNLRLVWLGFNSLTVNYYSYCIVGQLLQPRVVHGFRMDPRVGSGRVGLGHDFAGFWRVGSGRVSTSGFWVFYYYFLVPKSIWIFEYYIRIDRLPKIFDDLYNKSCKQLYIVPGWQLESWTHEIEGGGSGRVGSDFLSEIAGRVGSTFSPGRVGSKKSDPWTTLLQPYLWNYFLQDFLVSKLFLMFIYKNVHLGLLPVNIQIRVSLTENPFLKLTWHKSWLENTKVTGKNLKVAWITGKR